MTSLFSLTEVCAIQIISIVFVESQTLQTQYFAFRCAHLL